MRNPIRTLVVVSCVAAFLALPACSVNPATGKYQVALIGESQEREMGKAYDRQIVVGYGLVDDAALQSYVQRLGEKLAATSERPGLDWTFRVLDDPQVNAFALPGGYIYVTRGILAHLNSEAELAAVIGHEIGHVTARHSVNQLSKQQLAQLGLGLGSLIDSKWTGVATDVASAATGLVFLKYSRDDESQADGLGWRYLMATGFDPRPMPDVFETLRRVGEAAGARGTPAWLATHPEPADRRDRFERKLAKTTENLDGRRVARDTYLQAIDGIAFGDDPRQGYFVGARFYHPELAFVLDFPGGWTTRNARDAVSAQSPKQDAFLKLQLADHDSARAALDAFLGQDGIQAGAAWIDRVDRFPAASRGFTATDGQTRLQGLVLFLEDGERVFALLGVAPADRWTTYEASVRAAMQSYRRLTDRAALDVEPRRVAVVRPGSAMNLSTFADRFSASVDDGTLALINHLDDDSRLSASELYKVVRGGRLP